MMREKILLATTNEGKRAEFAELLSCCFARVDALPHGFVMPEETGATFLDNARIKACAVARETGRLTLADDSGLVIDALGGEPGVRSARYAGDGATDEANRLLVLERMKSVLQKERTARFVCALVLVDPHGQMIEAEGECSGFILDHPKGERGFGYDSLFWFPAWEMTFAEVSREKKASVSHRARALQSLIKKMEHMQNER